MIEITDMSKLYGRHSAPAVDHISLTIKDGEILGFAGLNGAGKTTTINCVSGVLLPSGGHVLVDGNDVVNSKVRASKGIGWVSEFPTFEQNVKPEKLLGYYAGFYGLTRQESDGRIKEILRSVGLERALDRKLRTFSQGMKKRFGLATAMISDPQNYLLDEILNGLDPEGVNYVRKQVLDFKKAGKSILLSTHILGILEDIADRIAIIQRGRIREIISREKFRNLGKPVVKLKPDRIDANIMTILESFGKAVLDGVYINLMEVGDAEKVAQEASTALVKAGYSLSYLNAQGTSLEQYFLELTEGSLEAGAL